MFIWNPGNSGGGISSGTNLGTGTGIYAGVSGSALQFYSLAAGSNTSISLAANTITIAATGEVNQGENLGAGEGLYAGMNGDNLTFKSLVAGTGVSLTAGASTITIAGSYTLDNLDANIKTLALTGSTFEQRGLTVDGALQLTANSTTVTITGLSLNDPAASGVSIASLSGTVLTINKIRGSYEASTGNISAAVSSNAIKLDYVVRNLTALGTVTFVQDQFISDAGAGVTGNITLDSTGATLKTTVTILHNDTAAPTITGSGITVITAGTYVDNSNNYIDLQWMGTIDGNPTCRVNISQYA